MGLSGGRCRMIYQNGRVSTTLIPQTLPDAGESEYLIRYVTNQLRKIQ
jgi:hypothetical protein